MENTKLSSSTVSFGVALAVTCVVNALVVVAKESSKAVMTGMQKVTGHHWTTHVALVLVIFVGLGWGLSRLNQGEGPRLTAGKLVGILLSGLALGAAIIVGFYLIGD